MSPVSSNESQIDLAAVQADDALLDMLGSTVVTTDDDLSRGLYAWRRDVDAEPIPDLVIDFTEEPPGIDWVLLTLRAATVLVMLSGLGMALVMVHPALGDVMGPPFQVRDWVAQIVRLVMRGIGA